MGKLKLFYSAILNLAPTITKVFSHPTAKGVLLSRGELFHQQTLPGFLEFTGFQFIEIDS
jgi:hypothetical protein